MSRLQVVVLTHTTRTSGAARFIANTLPHLDRDTFCYRFAAFDEDGPLARACQDRGFEFSALPHRNAADPRSVWALRRLLIRGRIDLLHAHLPLAGAVARVAARGLPTRVIYTEHTTQDGYGAPTRWLNAKSYGWQEVVVAPSARVRTSAEEHIGRAALGRIAVIPSGVDLERLEEESRAPVEVERQEGSIAVLVPARLERDRGHDVLFRSLALLPNRNGRPIDVWLAGDGRLRAPLEASAKNVAFQGHIRFLGERTDLPGLMRSADLVALPRLHGGHPLSLIEALALGCPAVATAVGGVPEIVDDERTGLLVRPGDPRALAAALERLSSNPTLRGRIGQAAAREARKRFDVRQTVREVEELYRKARFTARQRRVFQSAARASVT